MTSDHGERRLHDWIDKLEIRDVIERSMRYIDDRAADEFAALFDDNGVMQLAGTVYAGKEQLRSMFAGAPLPDWTSPDNLLLQPGSCHCAANPIIEIDGETATAETDMLVVTRDEDGRARVKMIARYRDRLRRVDNDRWVITNRTGVSVARPSETGTEAEWARAFDRMTPQARAQFRRT